MGGFCGSMRRWTPIWIDELAEAIRIEMVHISTRKELGEACGIKVPAACAGLLKEEEGQ